MRARILASAALTLALTGCTNQGSTGAPSRPASSAPVTSPAATGSPSPTLGPVVSPSTGPVLTGPCANDYLPVVDGASWVYLRTAAGRRTTIHQSIESISGTGFTVRQRLKGGGERDAWICSSAGLANIEQAVPGTTQFHEVSTVGVTVPASVHPGSSWKQVVRSTTRFEVGGVSYPETQVVTTVSRAVGEETVSTAAGVFEALKVQMRSTTHKTAPTFGSGIDQRTTSAITEWWVAGVGVVRRIVDTGSGFPTTIELVRYRIP